MGVPAESGAVTSGGGAWQRVEAQRRELADRAAIFADLGLAAQVDRLGSGAVPRRLVGTPIILDTDVGGDPDDTIALILAARLAPELALVLTTDEIGGERARFARHLLDLAGRPDVPVVAGRQLTDRPCFCAEGLARPGIAAQPTDLFAAVARVRAGAAGTVRWIGAGPMSNLADVLRVHPEWAAVFELTQMGGALRYRDPQRAEHNFRLDPGAARAVLAAIPEPTLVTSDVTFSREIEVTAGGAVYRMLRHSRAPAWAGPLTEHLDRWFARFHPGSMQHDALTLSAGLQLPFLDLDLIPVVLAEDARMTSAAGGVPLFVSIRADYAAFNNWLVRGLAP